MDEEQKVYAQIAKDQYDLNSQRDKEWQEFLKVKQQAINQYGGDNNMAKLVYEDREKSLLEKFSQQQAVLDAREDERWMNYHSSQSLETSEQSLDERKEIDQQLDEVIDQTFEKNRQDMMGARPEPGSPELTKTVNPVERTAENYEQLLQNERSKRQDVQIDKETINAIDVDKAYSKTVNVEISGVREETKQERIDRKMREWEEAQKDKTQQRSKSQEM